MFTSGQTIASKPRTPEMDEGRHHRAKLGFILMSTDLAAEADFNDMAPEGVGVHITRLKTDDYTTSETMSRVLSEGFELSRAGRFCSVHL